MDLYLGHESALQFWRSCVSLDETRPCSRRRIGPAYAGAKADDRYALYRYGIDSTDLHVMVGRTAERRYSKSCHPILCTLELPMGSLRQIAGLIYVASPELTLVQLAHGLAKTQLIQLIYELCGTYRMRASGVMYDVEPLTSPEKIGAFCRKYYANPSKEPLVRALRMVCANSASPMETVLTMMLCCPKNMGGYGLPFPELNTCIALPSEYAYRLGSDHFKCDLYWKKASLALEYDSDEEHAKPASITKDALRRNALESLGVRMLTATWAQARSLTAVDMLAHEVSRILGHRFRRMDLSFYNRRNKFHDELLSFTRR